MKIKGILRKAGILVFVLSLIALIALAAMMVTSATDKATFSGVQVAANGDINLRFYYSNVASDVTSAKVVITDGTGGSANSTVYLKENTNGTYFQVPLASGQMGCDVTVTPIDGNGNPACAAKTWSVAKYGKEVLASQEYSADHNAIKAILNFGHFASEYFAAGAHGNVANTVVENEGIYALGTNPIYPLMEKLGSSGGPIGNVQSGYEGEYEYVGIGVSLESTVSLKLLYRQNGESKVHSVSKLGTKDWATDYSDALSLKDENGNVIISVTKGTVIEVLRGMASKNETKPLAAAAYGYYLATSGTTPDQSTCAHITVMEYVDDNYCQPVCIFCEKMLEYRVSDDVNYFSAPGQAVNFWNVGNAPETSLGDIRQTMSTVMTENGVSFTRIYFFDDAQVYFANATAHSTEHNTNNVTADKLNHGMGKYAVIKIRAAAGKDMRFQISTDKGANIGNNAKWMTTSFQTIILDLSALQDPSATELRAYFSIAGAPGACSYIDLAYFAVVDDIEDVKELVGTDAVHWSSTKWINPSNGGTADNEKKFNTWALFEASAYCPEYTSRVVEVKTPLNDGSDNCYVAETVTYKCMVEGCPNYKVVESRVSGVTHGHTAPATTSQEAENGIEYRFGCTTEGCTQGYTVLAPKGLNYFSAPGHIVNNWGLVVDGVDLGGSAVAITDIMEEDGIVFTRLKADGWDSFWITNGTVAASAHPTDSACVDKLNGGMGKYLVFKARAKGINTTLKITIDGTVKYTSADTVNGEGKIGVGKWIGSSWLTIVVDMSTLADAEAQNIGVYMQTRGAVEYLDIAYMAICNDPNQIKQLIGDDAVRYSKAAGWANGGDYELDYTGWAELCKNHFPELAEPEPPKECTHTEFALTSVSGNEYTYTCRDTSCAQTKTLTVPSGMNYYSAPGQVVNNWGSGNAAETTLSGTKTELTDVRIEDGIAFTRIHNYSSGDGWASFYLANGSVAANAHPQDTANVDKLTGGLGKYLVIKGRSSTGTNTKFLLETNTGKAFTPTEEKWFGVSWTTYVIDLSTIEDASADTIKTYMQIKGASSYLDIAYMAICNNSDQVKALVGTDGTVQNGTTLAFSKLAGWNNGDDYEFKYANWDELYDKHLSHICLSREVVSSNVFANNDPTVCYTYDTVTYTCSDPACHNYNIEKNRSATTVKHNLVTLSDVKTYLGASDANNCYKIVNGTDCSTVGCNYSLTTTTYGAHIYGLTSQKAVANGTEYTYACTGDDCGRAYAKIVAPEGVNYFSAPTQVITSSGSSAELKLDGSMPYTRVDLSSWTTIHLTNGTSGIGAHTENSISDKINGGVGNYAVIKLRSNCSTKVNFGIFTDSRSLNYTSRDLNSTFTTYVIDISTISDPYITNVGIRLQNRGDAANGEYIDIAYFAICDSYEEVYSLINNESKITYLDEWQQQGTEYSAPDAAHTEENWMLHNTSEDIDGNITYTFRCENLLCGEFKDVVVPAITNYFSAPGQIVNHWSGGNALNESLGDIRTKYTEIMSDGNVVFTRIYNTNQGWASFYLANDTAALTAHTTQSDNTTTNGAVDILNGGMGKFIVLKARGGFNINIFLVTNTGKSISGQRWFAADWTTVVVDISSLKDADANSVKAMLQLASTDTTKAVDIAYFAICDSWTEVDKLVGNDTVKYTTSWTTTGSNLTAAQVDQKVSDEGAPPAHESDPEFDLSGIVYNDGSAIKGAGVDWKSGTFAGTTHDINESAAQTITASSLITKLKNGTLTAGAVYKVTDTLTLTAGAYNANGAAIIADGGITISNATGVTLENAIIKGSLTITNSKEIQFRNVDIKSSATAVTIDAASSAIVFDDCRIVGTNTAINSQADLLTVYSCYLKGANGISSVGDDFTVQNSKIFATGVAVSACGEDVIIRENYIRGASSTTGIDIYTSTNALAALNDIAGIQNSITIRDSFNVSVVVNRAVKITGKNNTNLYVVDNKVGGFITLTSNNYLICDGNRYPSDALDHTLQSSGNTNVNGNNVTDVTARTEVGANEDLLPHTNKDLFIGMDRKNTVTDASFSTAKSFADYLKAAAANSDVVIVPPGAYAVPTTVTMDAELSNKTVYAYGVYSEYSETNVKNYEGKDLYDIKYVNNLNIYGLTIGTYLPTSGQVRVVSKQIVSGQYQLTIIPDAGFMDGFTVADPEGIYHDFWPEIFLYEGGEYKMFPEYNPDAWHYCTTNSDGTMTFTIRSNPSEELGWNAKDIYDKIQPGTIMTCRLGYGDHLIYAYASNNLYIRDVVLYGHSGSMANVAMNCENLVYERFHNTTHGESEIDKATYDKYAALEQKWGVDMEIRIDENGRYRGPVSRSGSIDGFHTTGSKHGYTVISSILEGMVDDGANQKGNSSRLWNVTDNGDGTVTIEYQDTAIIAAGNVHSSRWCSNFKKGDTVFIYAHSGKVLCETPALEDYKSVSSYNITLEGTTIKYNRYSVKVAADAINWDALKDPSTGKNYNYQQDSVTHKDSQIITVDNLSYNASGFTMDNVVVNNGHSRGFLIKATDVTIKHCTFKNVSYAALLIEPEAGWAESTLTRRLLVQQCLFDNTGYMSNLLTQKEYACITICADSTIVSEDTLPMDDITITGCKFTNNKHKYAIYLNSVKNVKITNNIFDDNVYDAEFASVKGAAVLLGTCMNVEISGNTYNYSHYNGNINNVVFGENYKNIFGTDVNGQIPDKLN